VEENFRQCDAAFLEANYDEQLLHEGHYPYNLKERIKSNKGHLSNLQALDLFINHKHESMSLVILSHLSKDNNCPIIVKDLFTKHAQQTNIIIASRHQETELFHIRKQKVHESRFISQQTLLFE
jgi:phosphoribosyl 1,2-cyclic phosphodiesterase